jgi:predicted outer membrane repeat protein
VQDAIDNASDGDTITLCVGTFMGNLDIDKDLTLVGAGEDATILQGDGVGSVVVLAPTATVTIRDLRISGGNDVDFGGGIFSTGTLEMIGVTVRGNSSQTSGGGIVTTGTLEMTGCTVTGNSSNIGGGINNRGTLTLNGCTVSENTAIDFGGGIFNAGTGAVMLHGGAVDGNDAGAGGGGGIFNSGTVTLAAGATIMANDAIGNGGGIFNDDSAGGGISTCTGGSSVSGNDPNDCFAAPGGRCDGC